MKDLWLTALLSLAGIGLLIMAAYSQLPASVLGLVVLIAVGIILASALAVYIIALIIITLRKNDHDK